MINTASLRVYLPVGRGVEPPSGHRSAVALRRRTIGTYGVLGESMSEDAFVADWNDQAWICPRHPRLRILEGVLATRAAYEEFGGAFLVSDELAARAASELADIHQRHPAARSYILTSAWHVPIRWFASFDPEEREVYEEPCGLNIRYRTPIREARKRLRHVAGVLDEAGLPDPIVSEVGELAGWLDDFGRESMVELDYGSVARFFSDGDLALDESCSDVWASINSLEQGDYEGAGEGYMDVMTRWAPAVAVAFSS